MRYNQNYQCNKCQTEVQSLEAPWFSECHVCGGRAITKTVKHRAPVTVDDERFIKPKKYHDATIGLRKLEAMRRLK